MYKLGWFSTGRGEGSKGLLRAAQSAISSGELEAEIEFVFCSRERGETGPTDQFLQMVEDYGIPLVCFSYQKYRRARGERTPPPGSPMPQWRLDYDRESISRLKDFQPDLCVLAGYLLILGKEMSRKYNIINLHPAAPGGPAGIWQDVIWKLIETDAGETGAMMHLAIPELDEGPVVTYCKFQIKGGTFDEHWQDIRQYSLDEIRATQGENNPLFKLIRQNGVVREVPLVLSTIRAFSQGRVKIDSNREITDTEGSVIDGYDLTSEIDELVAGSTG
jgi:phosphoribosylglycinamide formyltransferase-1